MGKRCLLVLGLAILILGVTVVSAQDTSGTIIMGQPAIGQIQSAGATLSYDYTLADLRQVSLQALSDTAQPTVSISRDGTVVAAAANAVGESTVTLAALLAAGDYVVEVGTTNGTTGLVVLNVLSETPVTQTPLTVGAPVTGSLSADAPAAFFSFSALAEPAYLYVDSDSTASGVHLRFGDGATGKTIAESSADVLGVRYRFGAGSQGYTVEISTDGAAETGLFTICLTTVSTGGCEGHGASAPPATAALVATALPAAALPPTATSAPVSAACTVTPNVAGGVNIRQSATTNSSILGTLPGNASADVIGISPGGSFYNIRYGSINGWVALYVVNSSGDCGNVAVVNPPPVPTQPPAPTQAANPVPSGPCLITITSPTFIYTTTTATMDYLFDQVQSGQLLPIGRLADNSWWQTNNYGAWIPASAFGSTAQISGNCDSVPITSPSS